MKQTIINLLVALFLSAGLTACGSGRKAVVPAVGDSAVARSAKHFIPTDNKAVNELLASYDDSWHSFRVPVNMALKSPKAVGVSGRLTVVNGTGLNLSIRTLGFEVASLTVVGDSIFAYEKLGKRCVAESVGSLVANIGVSTDDAVRLLMGHLFMLDESTLSEADGQLLQLLPARQPAGAGYGWMLSVDKGGAVVPDAFVVEVDQQMGMLKYAGFVASPAGPVAKTIDLQVATGKMVITGTLSVDYGKAEWNGNFKVDRPAMKGYRRVTGTELLQMFKTLM